MTMDAMTLGKTTFVVTLKIDNSQLYDSQYYDTDQNIVWHWSNDTRLKCIWQNDDRHCDNRHNDTLHNNIQHNIENMYTDKL